MLVVVVAALVLTGCDPAAEPAAAPTTPARSPSASPSPSPSPSPTAEPVTGSDCPNEATAVVSEEPINASGTSGAGGGDEVEVAVVVDREAPLGCQAFLVATVGNVISSNVIEGDLQLDFNPPQIRALSDVDGVEGPEAFVTVQSGASTEFGMLFLLDPVRPVRFEDPDRGNGDLLAFGGSVTHLDGAACVPGEDGTVVISTAGSQAKRYRLERRFYRFEDDLLIEIRSEMLTVSFKQLVNDFPEFSTQPFSNCPT
jgi:hypothetical protein